MQQLQQSRLFRKAGNMVYSPHSLDRHIIGSDLDTELLAVNTKSCSPKVSCHGSATIGAKERDSASPGGIACIDILREN